MDNFRRQSPVSINHNLELEDVDNANDYYTRNDRNETNPQSKVLDERSHSSATIEPVTVSNTISPSPQDSPLFNESNQEQYLNNGFFGDEKLEQNNDGDHLFELSPDQQQAFRELELRKQQADYDNDYDYSLNYDELPEYDVREKLQSLNAQLANEPLPPDGEHRNSKVVFRDEIISLVAPADDYDQSESEPDDPSYNTDVSGQSPALVEKETTYTSPVLSSDNVAITSVQSQNSTGENEATKLEETKLENEVTKIEDTKLENEETEEQSPSTVENTEPESNDMVVSRGGKFLMLDSNDIIDKSNHSPKREDNDDEHKRTRNRPVSAPASKRQNKDNDSGSSTKSDVNNSRSNSNIQKQSDRSKIQIPRVDKEALRRQQERKKKEEEDNLKREEEELTMRKEMNTKSFNCWLQTKQKHRKEEEERKKKEEDEEKEKKEKQQDERKTIAEDKEKEAAKKMENDRKREEKLKQYRQKEMEESIIVHSEEDCQKAFKRWLRNKQKDNQRKAKEERQRARITRLAMRQCRKSQDLAQAIHQSSSFRYLDFCGYP